MNSAELLVALPFSLLIGLALGLLGGGGSILMLPVLIYLLEVPPRSAVATSLLVVCVTSLAALIPHARAGRVRLRAGLTFGAAGMLAASATGRVAHHVPAGVLLVCFATIMIVTAVAMMRSRRTEPQPASEGRPLPAMKVLMVGLLIGAVTGLVGAGGGFVVVPALVLLFGLTMQTAVATSLVVIVMNTSAGLLGYARHAAIDGTLAGVVSVGAVLGSVVGARLAGRVSQDGLRKGFAWFVLALGGFMLVRELPQELGSMGASILGGVLIGLSGAVLLLGLGRIAGISGIFAGLLLPRAPHVTWRLAFVAGLVLGGVAIHALEPQLFAVPVGRSLLSIATAGLLVGFGTRLANGCTSGHGVCGLSRLSVRSLVATATFMLSGALTVYLLSHVFGGSS